jgi:hypothetical protein
MGRFPQRAYSKHSVTATVAALFKVVQLRIETPIFTDPEHEYTGEDALRQ